MDLVLDLKLLAEKNEMTNDLSLFMETSIEKELNRSDPFIKEEVLQLTTSIIAFLWAPAPSSASAEYDDIKKVDISRRHSNIVKVAAQKTVEKLIKDILKANCDQFDSQNLKDLIDSAVVLKNNVGVMTDPASNRDPWPCCKSLGKEIISRYK